MPGNYMDSFEPASAPEPAAGAQPAYMRSFQPGPAPPDPQVIAHAASDLAPQQAVQALDVADRGGIAPQYAADGLDAATKARDKQKFATQLSGRPVLSSWSAQSSQHAAAARPDAEPLGNIEDWLTGGESWGAAGDASGAKAAVTGARDAVTAGFFDIAHAEAMREYMGSGGPLADKALDWEDVLRNYDREDHGFVQQVARAMPQMVMYGAGTVLAGPVGVAGLMYAQNKGVLARQIEKSQPQSGDRLSRDEIDTYATVGSAVGAVALSGLLTPILKSLPGVKGALQGVLGETFARAGATSVGQAAVRSLLAYGQHTLMGALGMTLQHVVNEATAQQAVKGEVEKMQLAREGAATFLKVLPIAATFAAYGPAKDFFAERGRLNLAPAERAKLDAMIEEARKVQLAKTAPQRVAELFGLMGRGVKVFIDWKAAQKMKGLPQADVAAAEVGQDSVAVPVGDYLTKFADQHEAVKDDVKLTADGMTMNEARARDAELRGTLFGPTADALFGPQTPDEILQSGKPVEEPGSQPLDAASFQPGAQPLDAASFNAQKPASEKISYEYKFGSVVARNEKGRVVAGLDLNRLIPGEEPVHVEERKGEGRVNPVGVLVEQGYQRQGIATAMYDLAEKTLGEKIAPGDVQTEDGKAFRAARAAAEQLAQEYGGQPAEWQKRLHPDLLGAVNAEGSQGAVAPEEYASRLIEALPVKDIDPAPYERLAKKADKYIQTAAEKARSGSAAGAKASSVRDVAVLSTYELARDVNRAKAAKAVDVKAEMQTIANTLRKQAGDGKLRAQLGLAGAPLLHLFDALTEGTSTAAMNSDKGWLAAHDAAVAKGAEGFSPEATDAANSQMQNALVEAKQWFTDMARPMKFDERYVEKFLQDPKPLGELKPAQARIIADAVKQLTTAAREERIVRSKDGQASVEEAAGEISGELRENPSKGLPLPSGVPSSAWRELKMDANAANAMMLRPKNNLRQKSAAAVKWIFDRINDAVYARDVFFRETGSMWKTAFEAMPDDIAKRRFETYDLSDKLPTDHLGLEPLKNVPRQYIWKLARHWMSKGNIERVVSSSGWDKDTISNILFDDPQTKLTVPEWDYLQSLADIHEKYIWPKLKEHFEKFYGTAPPKTAAVPFKVQLEDGSFKEYAGGYEPLKRDARPGVAPQPEPTKGIAQYWGKDFQVPWTPESVKERVDGAHYLVNMDWDSSRATTANVLHWLAFDQPVRDVAKLLNDQGLSADMNQYMGEGRADMVRAWLKSSATRQASSIPEGMEVVGRAFGWQRRLQLMGIIGGSARLATAQVTHPFGLMLGGEVNPIHGISAFLSTFKPVTFENGEVRLLPNWADALEHSKEVAHRADHAYGSLRQTWDKVGPDAPRGALGAMKDVAQRTAGLFLHAVDRLTTTWAWNAFHNEAVAKGLDPYSPEAVRYADGRTQDVMPVHDIETAAPLLTNRQIGGFLIMHGFKNTLYNMRQDALAKTVQDFHLADSPGAYGGAIARTAGRVALQTAMFGGFAVMGKLALGYGQQDDETKGQWLARDFLGGQFVDMPFIGGLAEPLAKFMVGGRVSRHDFTTYGNPGMALVNKAADTLGNLVSTGREDYKKVFDVLEAALFATGVPSRPPRVAAEHIYEMLMGEGYQDEQGGSAGRMFYTDQQWESIKRSLTPEME
jgi:hypothetical protein